MKRVIVVSLLLLSLLAAAPVTAAVGVGVKAGTLGIGPELHYGINDMLSLTVAGKYLAWSYDFTADDVDYEGDLGLLNLGLFANFHPGGSWLSGMRITGGLFLNKNDIGLKAGLADDFSYGGFSLTDLGVSSDVAVLKGDVTFNTFSPYLGIGWGQVEGRRWGFAWDLGVIYQGSPKVDLDLDIEGVPSEMLFVFEPYVQSQEAAVEEEIKPFKFYPVAQIGFYVRF